MAAKKKKKTAKKKKTSRKKRVRRLTLEGALISLATLEAEWEEYEWLLGVVLYGPDLRDDKAHDELSFMIVYEGLDKPSEMRKARGDMEKLIKRAAPVKRHLNFIDDATVLEQLEAGNPAVQAVFGNAIVIWSRTGS